MHHLTRLIGGNNNNPKKSMDHQRHNQKKRPKPKLDRKNAIKNSDYEAESSTSFEDHESSLRTRSLDLHPSYTDRTSFRIGGSDGDVQEIYLTLGLSGPEDFGISNDAWEARKAKSSSELLPKPELLYLKSINVNDDGNKLEVDENVGFESKIESRNRFSEGSSHQNSSSSSSSSSSAAIIPNTTDAISITTVATPRSSRLGGGINGVRPPLLAPPPSISLPVLDSSGSTWDLVRSFAPEEQHRNQSNSRGSYSSVRVEESDKEDEVEEEVGEGFVERDEIDEERIGENARLSDSSLFSTSNDEDSSSSTTDNVFIISPDGRHTRNIRSWTKGRCLGSGSYGTVYEALSDDCSFFAVKEVSLLDQRSMGQQSVYQLEQEIALLSRFEHENIVQYLGTDKAEGKLYIFLELVSKGSLADLYHNYNLVDSQVSSYTRQILHGLRYLHDQDVIHRDIKCANILVDANGSVKLADFGLAKTTRLNDVKSSKGTAFWMAPEVVNPKRKGYGLPADIWSLGCTVLEMLTRKLPYAPLEWIPAMYKIGKGEPPPIPNTLSADARDFIEQCVRVKPENRPTAAMLLDHSFVRRPLPASSGSDSPLHNRWR